MCSYSKLVLSFEYDIDFNISLAKSSESCMTGTAIYKSNQEGELFIQLPISGHFRGQFSGNDIHTQVIDHDHSKLKITSKVPQSDISLKYEYCYNNDHKVFDHALITSDEFYFTSDLAIPIPLKGYYSQEFWDIKFTFTDHDVKKIHSNLGDCSKSCISRVSHSGLTNSFFYGTSQKSEMISKKPDIHLLNNTHNETIPPSFKQNIKDLVRLQRVLFNDPHNEPFHVILNFKNTATYQVGKHPEKAIVMSAWQGSDLNKLLYAISHELIHEWLGLKIEVPLPQGEFQWFLEGLTDHLGLLVAYRSNIIKDETYLEILNSILRNYELNPHHSLSNDELAKYYYQDPSYSQLASYRGTLSSFILSEAHLSSSLENDLNVKIVRALLSHSNKNPVDWNVLKEVYSNHLGEKGWEHFLSQINGTTPITLPKTLLNGRFSLIEYEVDYPDFGFDVDDSIKHNKVGNINANSPAFKAGLRENDVISYSFFNRANPSQSGLIMTEDNKTFEFEPMTTVKKLIPQYVLNEKENGL